MVATRALGGAAAADSPRAAGGRAAAARLAGGGSYAAGDTNRDRSEERRDCGDDAAAALCAVRGGEQHGIGRFGTRACSGSAECAARGAVRRRIAALLAAAQSLTVPGGRCGWTTGFPACRSSACRCGVRRLA